MFHNAAVGCSRLRTKTKQHFCLHQQTLPACKISQASSQVHERIYHCDYRFLLLQQPIYGFFLFISYEFTASIEKCCPSLTSSSPSVKWFLSTDILFCTSSSLHFVSRVTITIDVTSSATTDIHVSPGRGTEKRIS